VATYGNTSTGPVVLDALTGADKSEPPRLAPEFVNEHVGIGTLDDENGMSTIEAFAPIT
jgi:hypothetical protein